MTPKPILGRMIVNGQANLVARALNGGTINFHDGEMPSDMESDPPFDTLLASATFASVAFSVAKDGTIRANKADRVQAVKTGDPTYVRCLSPAGELVFAGTVGKQDPNSNVRPNFTVNAKTMVEGQFVDITGLTYVVPRTF